VTQPADPADPFDRLADLAETLARTLGEHAAAEVADIHASIHTTGELADAAKDPDERTWHRAWAMGAQDTLDALAPYLPPAAAAALR
jgi:hypothetical protein